MSSAAEKAPSPSSPGEPTKYGEDDDEGFTQKNVKNSYRQSAEVITHYLSYGQAWAQKTDD